MRECQQLLNEIATARVVLLNAEKKVAYDNGLQTHIAPVSALPVASAEVPLTPADLLASAPNADTPVPKSPAVRARRVPRRRKKSSRIGSYIAIGGCLLGLLVCGIMLRMVLRNDSDLVAKRGALPNAR
ncbi:MAG: hypothetical protein QGF59_17650 [Pirellulaceae bacterium]|nr:hypothetical protein [Pirellulaceae bacterium]